MEAGLGSAGSGGVSLKLARSLAAEGREYLATGRDPLAEWRKAEPSTAPTFAKTAEDYVAAHEVAWKNPSQARHWRASIRLYCGSISSTRVDEIDTAAVLKVLKPVWTRIPTSAMRLRVYIESVLDAARALGHIDEAKANPARWRGHLDNLLPKRRGLARGHFRALDCHEIPAFVARLRKLNFTSAKCREFVILTAARNGEAIGAVWSELDLQNQVWIIPAYRMKSGKEHRVPLSNPAMDLLTSLPRLSQFIFPGRQITGPMSNTTMITMLTEMKANCTVHGMRSAFRDWAGNETAFPREVCEHALAHSVGDATELAYRRSDALEKRRGLMEAWGAYCSGEPAADNVVQFTKTA